MLKSVQTSVARFYECHMKLTDAEPFSCWISSI